MSVATPAKSRCTSRRRPRKRIDAAMANARAPQRSMVRFRRSTTKPSLLPSALSVALASPQSGLFQQLDPSSSNSPLPMGADRRRSPSDGVGDRLEGGRLRIAELARERQLREDESPVESAERRDTALDD